MKKGRRDHLSYLLRLWRVRGDERPHSPQKAVWRASLEDPHTREQKAFASLDDLFDFLQERAGGTIPSQVAPDIELTEGDAYT